MSRSCTNFGSRLLGDVCSSSKMNTVRMLLLFTTNFYWDVQQFNIKNVFLHDDVEEEIYVDIAPGFGRSLGTNKVYKLKTIFYVSWFEMRWQP